MTDTPTLNATPELDSPALAEPPGADDALGRLRASGRFSAAFLRAAERPYRLRVQG